MTSVSSSPQSKSMTRIPSLDGLRALSIFLVIALHTIQRFSIHHHVSRIWYGIFDGATGVYIFFVISGYLITKLLLNENQKRGTISLKAFYLRRALRILPPLYAYILFLVVLAFFGRLVLERVSIVSALFFFHNYVPGHMWEVEHFWSLSTEEQFYLLWPVILLYCIRRPGIAGRVRAGKVAIAVILAAPIVRVLSYLTHNPYLHNGYGFHMTADSLMFGCAVALLEGTSRFERVYEFATRKWWIPPVTILISDLIGARFLNYWRFPFGFTVTGTAIAFFLLWTVRNPESIVGKWLNARFVAHIGVLSYSMYLWQTFFLHEGNAQILGSHLKFLGTFPYNWLAILVVAELSRYLVELPVLRLREKLINGLRIGIGKRSIKQAT